VPQLVVDGQGVHADRHRLGGHHVELLAFRAVLVELVDHLAADGARPRPRVLDDLLRVRGVRVDAPELAAAVAEEDDQVVGLALLQLLRKEERSAVRIIGATFRGGHLYIFFREQFLTPLTEIQGHFKIN